MSETLPNAFAHKTIVVTGASSGIGYLVSKALAQAGAHLVLVSKNKRGLTALYDDIVKNEGTTPVIYPMNFEIAEPADYQTLCNAIFEEFGALDGLVLNAAFLGALAPIEHYDPALWHRVMQVNVNANFMLVQALLPALKRSSSGRILFTTDQGAQNKAYWGAYAVSKSAIEGLCKLLALELEDEGIRVNCIHPGPVRSFMRSQAFPAENPHSVAPIESVIPAYLRLLGKEGEQIHGEIVQAQ